MSSGLVDGERRAGLLALEGVESRGTIAVEMGQDAIDHIGLGNEGDDSELVLATFVIRL